MENSSNNTTSITNTLQDNIDYAVKLTASAISDNTKQAYKSRFKAFSEFCEARGITVASPVSVAAFISEMASQEKSVSTIEQSVSAIRYNFESRDMESPTENMKIKKLLQGVRRNLTTKQRQVDAITPTELKTLVNSMRSCGLKYYRDRAMLIVGFCGAFRRSELVALKVSDLKRVCSSDGQVCIQVTVRKSKTDQEGHGMVKVLFPSKDKELCPVSALNIWLNRSGITEGLIFRHVLKSGKLTDKPIDGRAVADVIKQAAKDAMLDTDYDFSGHSLRRGFVTTAFNSGASDLDIMRQSGHRSATVLNKYKQIKSALEHNAANGLL